MKKIYVTDFNQQWNLVRRSSVTVCSWCLTFQRRSLSPLPGVGLLSVAFTCHTNTAVVRHSGDLMGNGGWSLMGWSGNDNLSQHRECGQQLVIEIHVADRRFFLTVFLQVPYLSCYVDQWVPWMAWRESGISVKVTRLQPDVSGCLNFRHSPCILGWDEWQLYVWMQHTSHEPLEADSPWNIRLQLHADMAGHLIRLHHVMSL